MLTIKILFKLIRLKKRKNYSFKTLFTIFRSRFGSCNIIIIIIIMMMMIKEIFL